jgi:hypothetical protein
MSFLDNLENNLNALERVEEKDSEKVKREQERRESERSAALKRAPHAEALKRSAFTGELMTQCRTISHELRGHGQRVLVTFTWLGENLRLDAKNKRLELMPTAEGIVAVFSLDGTEVKRAKVDTEKDDAGLLAKEWLKGDGV